jgi:O-methyltransferase involved in polyketide biosynthesis
MGHAHLSVRPDHQGAGGAGRGPSGEPRSGLGCETLSNAVARQQKWVEVDLPEILDYKEELLKPKKPACTLERVRADLSDAGTRRSLLGRLAGESTKALVVTEGLLIYLRSDQVVALAEDLNGFPVFRRWVLDIASPRLLPVLQKNTHQQFSSGVPPLQFAPEDGPAFFARHGWNPTKVHSMLKTAARLNRLTLVMRLLALLPESPNKSGSRPWSGVCLLNSERS